jgi:phage internal scaffolding protein
MKQNLIIDCGGGELANRRLIYAAKVLPPNEGLVCPAEGLTKQSFKEECDINTIVRMFGVTGKVPANVRMPTYGDFEDVGDFREAMEAINAASASFAEMPSEVRERFSNDPAKFVDFCSNEANKAEAERLGLTVPKPVPVVPVVPDVKA